MRCLASFILLSSVIGLKAQEKTDAGLQTMLPGKVQPEYFLDRAEKLGWVEKVSERSLHSSTFVAPDGKRIAFSSAATVNYKQPDGTWKPVDIRPRLLNGRWEAMNQPYPLAVNADASVSFSADGQHPI
ncbi:MAG: hypothetical protein ACHQF2_08360, partial [Flavobacteriales bacterium]